MKTNIFLNIANFLKEVRVELKKVNWPSRKETIRYTMIVIFVSLALALYLGGIDALFTAIINKFIMPR